MNLKETITFIISQANLSNKEVVAILDDIRKDYHNPKNIGDKNLSKKEHSKMLAEIHDGCFPVSKDRAYVFYKGDWRKVKDKSITYLGNKLPFKLKCIKNTQLE